MSEHADRYYRPSGRVPFIGTLTMLGLGTLAALAYGFLYAVVAVYNPIGYAQVFATIAFGAALPYTVIDIAHRHKVRHRAFRRLIACVIGGLGIYFSWVWYIYVLTDWDSRYLIFNPPITFEIIKQLADRGVWSVDGRKPTGFVLYFLWGLEATFVLVMCYFVNRESDTPFCEECECWTKKMDGLRIAAVEDSVLTQALEEEEYALIAQQASQEINLGNYVSLIGYACPKCRETNYLTASTVQLVLGKNGYEYQIRLFVKPIAVPRDVIELTQYLYQQAEKAEREANQQISAQSEPDETTV